MYLATSARSLPGTSEEMSYPLPASRSNQYGEDWDCTLVVPGHPLTRMES